MDEHGLTASQREVCDIELGQLRKDWVPKFKYMAAELGVGFDEMVALYNTVLRSWRARMEEERLELYRRDLESKERVLELIERMDERLQGIEEDLDEGEGWKE